MAVALALQFVEQEAVAGQERAVTFMYAEALQSLTRRGTWKASGAPRASSLIFGNTSPSRRSTRPVPRDLAVDDLEDAAQKIEAGADRARAKSATKSATEEETPTESSRMLQ